MKLDIDIDMILNASDFLNSEVNNLVFYSTCSMLIPRLGNNIYEKSKKLHNFLEDAGVMVKFELEKKIHVEWTELFLINPEYIDNADLSKVRVVLTIIFKAAQMGNTSFLSNASKELVSTTNPDIIFIPLSHTFKRLIVLLEQQKTTISNYNFDRLFCPVCGYQLREKELDPETKRIMCIKCMSVLFINDAKKTREEALKPSSNLFESYSNKWNPDRLATYQYDVFISYRHIESDFQKAKELAESFTSTGLRTFFAPKSLWMENLLDLKGTWPTQWVSELEQALLTSVHFVIIVSKNFFKSTHCELELRSIYEICNSNPSRSYWLNLFNCAMVEIPIGIRKKIRENDSKSLSIEIKEKVREINIKLGSGPITPGMCFTPLPLETIAWGEGRKFDPDPPKGQFENIVRELLLLHLRGLNLSEVDFVFPQTWQQHHIDSAMQEVKELVRNNIQPFSESMIDSLKDIFLNLPDEKDPTKPTQTFKTEKTTTTNGPKVYDPDIKNWYVLNDYGGLGYPQDMDFECRKCKYREGVVTKGDAPVACPKCGYKG